MSKKTFNPLLKLATNPKFSKYLKGQTIAPINVEISPSGKCNATCEFCFYSTKKGKEGQMIGKEQLKKALEDMVEMGVESITWTGGGEPTLHKEFAYFSEYAQKIGLEQGLITNGLKVNYDVSIPNWIRVSKTPQFDKVNLSKFHKAKKIGICINYIGDQNEIFYVLNKAEEHNFDYVQIRPALNIDGKTTHIDPPNIRHSKLFLTDYKFIEASMKHAYSRCEGFHFIPFIWQDGDVDTCAYKRKNINYNLGSIYKQDFNKIMSNSKSSVRVQNDCQVCCRNHEINKAINDAKKLEDLAFP